MSERISDPTHRHTHTHHTRMQMTCCCFPHLRRIYQEEDGDQRPKRLTQQPWLSCTKTNTSTKKNKIKIPKKYPKEILGKLSKLQALHVQQHLQHQQQQPKVEFCCNALATPRRASLALIAFCKVHGSLLAVCYTSSLLLLLCKLLQFASA